MSEQAPEIERTAEQRQEGTVIAGSTGKRISGRPSLVRSVTISGKEVEVDYWNQVARLNIVSLEKVLGLAKTDSAYDMNSFIEGILYQGFDRAFYIKHALTLMSVKVFCQFAVLGAIRGSNLQKIAESSENLPQELITAHNSLSFVKKPKKRTDLTILRGTASIPHWCAYWMLKAKVGKKIESADCHACLQFPGAASLPMSKSVRIDHIKFCMAFSNLLPGGSFNVNIYMTAFNNPIPYKDIPIELSGILGVGSDSESRLVTNEVITETVGQLVRK